MYIYVMPRSIRTGLEVPGPTRRSKDDIPTHPDEGFTGFVQDKKASDLEERFSRALNKRGIGYKFRMRISPLLGLTEVIRNEPGEIEIDFLCVHRGQMIPVQIDGQISHYQTVTQRDVDAAKDATANNALRSYGARPVTRIKYDEIWTPEQTDRVVRRLFL